jgi:hypothetical protein
VSSSSPPEPLDLVQGEAAKGGHGLALAPRRQYQHLPGIQIPDLPRGDEPFGRGVRVAQLPGNPDVGRHAASQEAATRRPYSSARSRNTLIRWIPEENVEATILFRDRRNKSRSGSYTENSDGARPDERLFVLSEKRARTPFSPYAARR